MIDKKGFTLIELLAVITILGILMLVAIPAVSRTIENARKNTFITTAQTYVQAVRNGWAADEISCQIGTDLKVASALPSDNQYYYIPFDTDSGGGTAYNNATSLIGDGGKSSWGNADVKGFVQVYVQKVAGTGTGGTDSIKLTYYVSMVDTGQHGITNITVPADQLTRAHVLVTGATAAQPQGTECLVTG